MRDPEIACRTDLAASGPPLKRKTVTLSGSWPSTAASSAGSAVPRTHSQGNRQHRKRPQLCPQSVHPMCSPPPHRQQSACTKYASVIVPTLMEDQNAYGRYPVPFHDPLGSRVPTSCTERTVITIRCPWPKGEQHCPRLRFCSITGGSRMWFNSWSEILRVLIIGSAAYAAVAVVLPASGKRTLGQPNGFDFILTVAIGSTLPDNPVQFLRRSGAGNQREHQRDSHEQTRQQLSLNAAGRTIHYILTFLRPRGGYRGDDYAAADLGRCWIPGNGRGGAHWTLAGRRQHPGPM